MIRDPSDGSMKEINPSANEINTLPAKKGGEEITMFDRIKASILAGKVKPEKIHPDYAYQRAWNDGIDFALRKIIEIERTDPERVARLMGETGE